MDSKDDILSFCDNCRICLEVHDQMTSIKSLKERNDWDPLLIYFSIEIINDKRYPNKICETCVEQLSSTLSFKEKCESSLNYLEEILKEPVSTDKNEDKSFCCLSIKDELSSNAFDDFDNTSIKSEEQEDSINNDPRHENFEIVSSEIKSDDSETNQKVKEICKICSKSVSNLKKHQLTHEKSDSETSPETKIHTGEKPFVCQICSRAFTRKYHLKRHAETHDNEPKYFCYDCKTFFATQHSLSQHKKKFHGDNPPPKTVCEECGKAVSNISSHMKRKHSEFQFECKYCKKTFPYKSVLDCHLTVHEREGALKSLCTLCGKAFRTNGELRIHNEVNHSDECKYQCNYCERRFKTCSSCRKHERVMHLSDRSLECRLCQKVFPSKASLGNHKRAHVGEESFKSLCTLCTKSFRTKAELHAHNKVNHPEILNYQCNYCDKKFRTSNNRRKHEKSTHLNDRCFKCQFCPQAFTRRKTLINHVRTHTGEKPFVCSICSKAFAQKSTLVTHMKSHDRPLK